MLDLESLNEAQRKAVMHGSGPLLVLAGPGSGKTYTITQRIFYLLEREHIPPGKILVITFTKDAALSMQSRFLQLSKRTLPVNFGTFHSVFYHILRESHILQTNQILTLNQKKAFIIPILKQYISIENTASGQSVLRQSNLQHMSLRQIDSHQIKSQQTDSSQMDSRQIKSQQTDSSQMDSRQIKSQQTDSSQMDSRQIKSQQTDSRQISSRQIDSHLLDSAKNVLRQNDLSETAQIFLAAISYYKNTGEIRQAGKKLPREWQERFDEVLTAYEELRKENRGIDFDDMVFECRNLLQSDSSLRNYWQKRFDAILIDEFQDISPMQYEVVGLLAGEQHHIFAVGDDDQSIYGFRGSKPACLKRFVQEYNAEKICLNINYRSKTEIVKAANLVIGENKERFAKELYSLEEWRGHFTETSSTEEVQSVQKSVLKSMQKFTMKSTQNKEHDFSYVVNLHSFQEREEQYAYLIDQLRAASLKEKTKSVIQETSEPVESIGILFRTNTYMQGFAARLHKEGIPYVMKERAVNIYEHFVVKDIMAYLKLAGGKADRSVFLQVMNKPSRYISREAVGAGIPDFEKMIQYYSSEGTMSFRSAIYNESVIHEVEKWKRQMEYLVGLSPFAAVSYIRKVIGYEKYLREHASGNKDKMEEWMEMLEWLSGDAANYSTVREWLEAQEDYARALENGGTKDTRVISMKENGKKDRFGIKQDRAMESEHERKEGPKIVINLMTVHASKGLEFDKVYVPDCNEKIFPHGRMPDEETCEEERRVFYVAMTRAKKSLELLYLTGTKERPRLPSRFLNKLL